MSLFIDPKELELKGKKTAVTFDPAIAIHQEAAGIISDYSLLENYLKLKESARRFINPIYPANFDLSNTNLINKIHNALEDNFISNMDFDDIPLTALAIFASQWIAEQRAQETGKQQNLVFAEMKPEMIGFFKIKGTHLYLSLKKISTPEQINSFAFPLYCAMNGNQFYVNTSIIYR